MGRYDIFSALPDNILTPDHKPAALTPFQFIESVRAGLPQVTSETSPFTIGLIGYFSYEATSEAIKKPKILNNPGFIWGVYKHSIVVDHVRRSSKLYYWDEGDLSSIEKILSLLNGGASEKGDPSDNDFSVGDIISLSNRESYEVNFAKVIENIRRGNTYQVNYTQAHATKYTGDPFIAYKALRNRLPSPYSGYCNFGSTKILSFSPEQFIQKRGNRAFTSPIKGTRPRDPDPKIDAQNRRELEESEKDKAENLMIVDLLRNDLGKQAIPSTVQVVKLFELQSFANVHHLVSTIRCRLDRSTTAMDILESAWPGGSITGAPKKRSMMIIDKLEPFQRGVYCGSIGYLSASGDMDTNLCIRTIACDTNTMACWAGGGIVADSEARLEYREALDKIETLIHGLREFQRSR